MENVHRAATGGILLGECPVWSQLEQALYWVDIDGHAVHRLDPSTGVDERRPIGARPGSLALTGRAGELLVATEHRLVWLDWATGSITPWIDLEDPTPEEGKILQDIEETGRAPFGVAQPGGNGGHGEQMRLKPCEDPELLLSAEVPVRWSRDEDEAAAIALVIPDCRESDFSDPVRPRPVTEERALAETGPSCFGPGARKDGRRRPGHRNGPVERGPLTGDRSARRPERNGRGQWSLPVLAPAYCASPCSMGLARSPFRRVSCSRMSRRRCCTSCRCRCAPG